MRHAEEHLFHTFDGTQLFYRHWPAEDNAPADRIIVLFHRGHEHSGRLQHVVDELAMPGVPVFAWDARGHGRSPGERGFSPSLGASVRDVDAFVRHASQVSGVPMENVLIIAQSVGAVLVATWVHDYAPRIRGMVLASPAFRVKLYVPLARPGLALLEKLRGRFFVNSYVKARFLSHDPERIASYEADPLITRPIASHILLALYEAAERVVADAGAITVPTQLLISGADFVVHHEPQHAFFDRLGSAVKEKHVLEGFYHDTLGERDRKLAFDKIRVFVDKIYADNESGPDLLAADRHGHTAHEYRTLQQPLAALSPKGLYYGLTRLNMRTLGSLSDGIKLGLQTGFDSGSTLDYVYRNQVTGSTPLGKLADKIYLDSIGWRGIRARKLHLEQLIATAAGKLKARGEPIRVVDIAAGHGRYVLDALNQIPDAEHILLRDYSPLNVEQGSKLIEARGLAHKAQFKQGDAFDRDSLSTLDPKPTLAIVSGLYELFPDNPPILASLKGLADAVPVGGYLVYTNQPWHPQLEMIARALTSHRDGQPWVMRRRTQAEMDALVTAAGFRKLTQLIDEWGIFSVSLAERVA
ncbi:Monoacylglycerol lipase [Andreprevotia sp. IGB-42]|uniref:bifunctional alpha/beta hydrolase/class I SAM-dependent methyltransferase n=1 Tax=Andreprevotia sp. IGB-42 TaxID=2497473 RepID=UPI00135AF031|nr:bifunctional alpha/beta hydrolase/class I SAM-dependent methyltransferase [Andreprevotia sp. IGB-42]KAF0814116.1 Monoacylglycerol lipase [Andreprevotia sp. IGB-42]